MTIPFGPELRKEFQDVALGKCGDKPTQACREALTPTLQGTDITTHTKRFLPVLGYLVGGIVVMLAVQLGMGFNVWIGKFNVPQEVKFDFGDLVQIQSTGGAHTFAAVLNSETSTLTYQPEATPTRL
jgi:hypothetical protein